MHRFTLLTTLALGCASPSASVDASTVDAVIERDGAPTDAGVTDAAAADSAQVDAFAPDTFDAAFAPDAFAPDAFAPDASSPECVLAPLDTVACDDRWLTCRIVDGVVTCGDVSRTPLAVGAACTTIQACDRGMQCLRVGDEPPVCRQFCRVSETDCPTGRPCVRSAVTDIDETPVGLPAGIGVCD